MTGFAFCEMRSTTQFLGRNYASSPKSNETDPYARLWQGCRFSTKCIIVARVAQEGRNAMMAKAVEPPTANPGDGAAYPHDTTPYWHPEDP